MVIKIKGPSVNAPNLTKTGQNIDIPPGAFGENVDAAIANLGGDIADAANKGNIAFAKFDERRATVEANKAFKDLPISEGNALIAAKQDPNRNLPTFQPDYTAAQDKRNKPIIDGLSPRALPKFMVQYTTLQKNQALDAMNWARGQEVVEGRNEMNDAVAKLVSTASIVADIGALKDEVEEKIFEAHINNFLLNGKMQPLDPNVEFQKQSRLIDRNKALSLILASPQQLLDMIEDENQLTDLTDADETDFRNKAESSRKRIKERADFSRFAAEAARHPELSKRIADGDPSLTPATIQSYNLPDWAEDYWIEELSGSEEGKIRKRQAEIERNIEAKKRAGVGTNKKTKVSATREQTEKDNLNTMFINIAKVNEDGDVTGVESLNLALGYVKKILELHTKGILSDEERKKGIEVLLPSLTEMIDSKYWEGADRKGLFGFEIPIPGTGRPALSNNRGRIPPKTLFGGNGRPRNIYADQYNSAISKLEIMSTFANTERNRVIVMANVLKHVEIAKSLDDEEKKQEWLQNTARNSVIDLMYEVFDETKDIPYDEYPTSIGTRTPNEFDTIEKASEADEVFEKQDVLNDELKALAKEIGE